MFQARDFFDHKIQQEIKGEKFSNWFDNQTQLRALHLQMPITHEQNPLESVYQLFNENGWDHDVLMEMFHEEVQTFVKLGGWLVLLESSPQDQPGKCVDNEKTM